MATYRVLFVDDEPRVLDAIRLRLRRQREHWEVFCADAGAAALDLLGREPIDVVVSDLRMPGVDGATLLALVKARHPQVVRIALSGQTDAETAMRVVPVAHQFLTKPCPPGVIEDIVERTCRLQRRVNADEVTRTVGRIASLPPVPHIYAALTATLSRDTATAGDIGAILERDPALCAKTLQLVNSAFFRISRRITRIDQAVTFLGCDTIRQVALAAEVFHHASTRELPISAHELQAHALKVAHVTKAIAPDTGGGDDAFVVGLLHDIGKLLIASELPALTRDVLRHMTREAVSMHDAERALLGTTHAEIGAYLLGLWGLPFAVVEAVAEHHEPVGGEAFGLAGLVHVADALVHEHDGGPASLPGGGAMDEAFLVASDVARHVPRWREVAGQTLADIAAFTG